MLDDEDLDFTILVTPTGGWIITILGIIAVIIVAIIVSDNKEECAKRHCEHGSPILAHHECMCVERPEAP